MKYLGSKTLETKRLILHKTEEKDLKELWNILCIDCVNKYYLTSKLHFNWEEEIPYQISKLENSTDPTNFTWTIELKEDIHSTNFGIFNSYSYGSNFTITTNL